MFQIEKVFSGFKNLIFPNEEIELLAESRLKICFECPLRVDNKCDKSKGGCGCYLSAKVRSPNSNCPKKKW